MNLNLRQLQALVSIARLGSFTKAAELLHVSQPALTVQIHHLEQALGVRLLDRNTRSVKLTSAGREVVPVLEGVLRSIDGLIAGTRDAASMPRGVVDIAALPSVCSTFLPPVIAKFRGQYPGISVTLRDATAQRVVAHVKAEEVDFGIASVAGPEPGVQLSPLIMDRLRVAFPRGHPLGQLRAPGLRDLRDYPMIAMSPESSVRFLVDHCFNSIGHLPAPAYEVTHTGTAVAMVKAGLGIAIVSSTALKVNACAGLRSRPIRHPGFVREISVIRKSGRVLSQGAENFLKSMVADSVALAGP